MLYFRVLSSLIEVIKIRAGNIVLFIESKTCRAQPGSKILIAPLGKEMAPHESLKNEELYDSGSSKIEY